MDDDFKGEDLGLLIAGMDVNCLLRDLDEIELGVSELALYGHFYKESFSLIQDAQTFWLEDGEYAQCADSIIQTWSVNAMISSSITVLMRSPLYLISHANLSASIIKSPTQTAYVGRLFNLNRPKNDHSI